MLAVFVFLIVAANAAEDYCYKQSVQACSGSASARKLISTSTDKCSARYGAIEHVVSDLQAYANNHIIKSFELLMMSTHFGNYETNRPGFQKVLRELSDTAWEDAFDLIKYIGKRGEKMNFGMPAPSGEEQQEIDDSGKYELYELESLAKALDMEKELALEAHGIHKKATRSREQYHDPEVSAYIEESN